MKKLLLFILLTILNLNAKSSFATIKQISNDNYQGYTKGLFFYIDTNKYINQTVNNEVKIK